MPGHLEKRSKKSWTIVIEAGRDPATGKRKRIKRAFQGTKREAEKEMARLIAELEKGTYIEPAKLTLGEYLQEWLDECEIRNLSPTTIRRYTQIVKLRVIPKIGMIPLDKLKPIHLQKFLHEIIEEGRLDKPGVPLSNDSIKYHYRVLHKALQDAAKRQLIPVNPADAVDLPKAQPEIEDENDFQENVQVLTPEQVEIMLDAAKDTPYYALLFVAIRTGLRRGELLGLRWQDVDLKAGKLSVKRALAYTPKNRFSASRQILFKPR